MINYLIHWYRTLRLANFNSNYWEHNFCYGRQPIKNLYNYLINIFEIDCYPPLLYEKEYIIGDLFVTKINLLSINYDFEYIFKVLTSVCNQAPFGKEICRRLMMDDEIVSRVHKNIYIYFLPLINNWYIVGFITSTREIELYLLIGYYSPQDIPYGKFIKININNLQNCLMNYIYFNTERVLNSVTSSVLKFNNFLNAQKILIELKDS